MTRDSRLLLRDVTVERSGTRNPTESPDSEFNYVDISGVDNEQKQIVSVQRLIGRDAPSRARKVIRQGDVLVSTVRPNLNAIAIVPNDMDSAICSTGYCVLRANERVLAEYLFYFVQSQHFLKAILGQVSGAMFPATTDAKIRAVEIPVPSIAEQHRIVDILKRADGIRRLRKQAIQTARELIPALFHQSFNAGSSAVVRLDEVAEVVSGVTKGRRFNGQKTVVVPYLRVANVQAGHLDLGEIKTIEVLPSDVERLRLRHGDVLLTEGGDYDKLGRGALWEQGVEDCIHQNHIFRVRVDRNKLSPVYFANFLQTQAARSFFLKSAKRTTNLASINMTQLRSLPVPLPSLSTQAEFVDRVADVRSIERQHTAAETISNQMFQSLLHRAFRGEL